MNHAFAVDFDFSKFAPASATERPVRAEPPDGVAANENEVEIGGELASLGQLARTGLSVALTCLLLSSAIIRHRMARWFTQRILHSLFSAWVIAGLGWGLIGAAGLSLITFLP